MLNSGKKIRALRNKKNKYLILQYLPHVSHFPKSLPLSHFPQTVSTLPIIPPFVRVSHIFSLQTVTTFEPII
jgi:hypothetical protein